MDIKLCAGHAPGHTTMLSMPCSILVNDSENADVIVRSTQRAPQACETSGTGKLFPLIFTPFYYLADNSCGVQLGHFLV